MKKIISLFLILLLVLSSITSAFAAELTTDGGKTEVPIEMEIQAAVFSVTVPTTLPVSVSADGAVITANDAKIINNTAGPVKISSMVITPKNDWTLKAFTYDFGSEKVNTKMFGFNIFGNNVPESGSIDVSGLSVISGKAELLIPYDARFVLQSDSSSGNEVAGIVTTVAWEKAPGPGLYQNGELVTPWDTLVADGSITVSGTEITAASDSLEGELIIADGITYIWSSSFDGKSGLTSVTIPSSVTDIGAYAFNECTNLANVNLNEGLVSIHGSVFYRCSSLENIEIPNSVTDIGSFAFDSRYLKKIIWKNVEYTDPETFASASGFGSSVWSVD